MKKVDPVLQSLLAYQWDLVAAITVREYLEAHPNRKFQTSLKGVPSLEEMMRSLKVVREDILQLRAGRMSPSHHAYLSKHKPTVVVPELPLDAIPNYSAPKRWEPPVAHRAPRKRR